MGTTLHLLDKTIGENISKLMTNRYIEPQYLADRLGIDNKQLKRYLAGTDSIPANLLLKFADNLMTSLYTLYNVKSDITGLYEPLSEKQKLDVVAFIKQLPQRDDDY